MHCPQAKGETEGLITEKIPYEISKSWDLLKISGKISRFQERFQDFMEISRFHLAKISGFPERLCKISRFQ